jgi:hypothetical protein
VRRLSIPARQRMQRRIALLVVLGAALVVGLATAPVTLMAPLT